MVEDVSVSDTLKFGNMHYIDEINIFAMFEKSYKKAQSIYIYLLVIMNQRVQRAKPSNLKISPKN